MEQPNPEADPEGPQESRLASWLRPLFEDSMLWPLVVVLAIVLGTFGASLLLLALERNPFAVAALLGVAFLSFEGYRSDRRGWRPGLVGRVVLGLWLASAGVVVASYALGLA